GNARGDRRGHQQGRGGGVNPQSLTADQERELTRYYNRYGRQLTRGDLRDLRKEAGGNVCFAAGLLATHMMSARCVPLRLVPPRHKAMATRALPRLVLRRA
ncbi:hypothetical protein Vretifemale_17949, partial [Volvox reticuliferus]